MKTITYGKLFISLLSTEIKNDSVAVNIKIKNNASVQTIIFPNEEVRLLADDAPVELDNYKFENNLDPGQETEGNLSFKIAKKPKKMVLQFGKLSLPKVNAELK